MRGLLTAFNVALSGVTAYAVGALVAAHEGPLACHGPAELCTPDELPGLVFLISWPILYLAANKMTRSGRKK